MNTVKKIDKRIEVEQLKKRFHVLANSPPKYDPFSGSGGQAWEGWAQTCRDMEVELREAGEDV